MKANWNYYLVYPKPFVTYLTVLLSYSLLALLIQEGLDVNLTAYLLNLERCEHVAEIEWYNDHGCKFANCNSCHYCEETPDANNLASVFRNRLQYTRGSLLLTGIQGSDDGLKIRIKVSMKASRGMVAVAKSIHVYTLLLFVYTVSPGSCSN